MIEKNNNYKLIYSGICGYIGTVGLIYYLKIGAANSINFSNNIMFYIICACSCMISYYSVQFITKRKLFFSLLGSVVYSSMCLVGAQIEYLRAMSWTIGTLLKILCLSVWIFPILIFLFSFLNEYSFKKIKILEMYISPKCIFLVIFLVWGLAYLALFPGIYDYDSISQTFQFLVSGEVNGHHPVLHSFLISFFMEIGKRLFDSYEIGLGFFTFLQLIFLAYVATRVLNFLQKKNYKRLFLFGNCFYLFFPLHYIMVMWDTKDTLFTAFFVLVSLELIELIDESTINKFAKYKSIIFVINVLFMCMIRNNAMYALILLIPLCFLCVKKYRKRIIFLFIMSLVLFGLYQNILLPNLGVEAGNKREMLSIPCQQLAKVYVETPDVFSQEEKEILFELIPEKNIMDYQYRPMISDATKNYLDTDKLMTDLPKYGKLYLEIGLRSPRKYIEAFLQNSCGFWYPNKEYPDERMFHPYTEFEMADPNLFGGDYIYLERHSLFPIYEKVLKLFSENTIWRRIPLISNFFVPGMYFFVILLGVGLSFYRKNYEQLFIFCYWAAYWFTLLISPVALVRYAYPVIMGLPLMLSLIGNKNFLKREE